MPGFTGGSAPSRLGLAKLNIQAKHNLLISTFPHPGIPSLLMTGQQAALHASRTVNNELLDKIILRLWHEKTSPAFWMATQESPSQQAWLGFLHWTSALVCNTGICPDK